MSELAYVILGLFVVIMMIIAYHKGSKDGYEEGYEEGYFTGCDPNERWN